MGSSFLWSQFTFLAPWLLVCLVAFVLALVNFRRSFVPSLTTLIGVSIMVTEMVSVAMILNYLITQPGQADMILFRQVSLAGSAVRAVGFLMIVIAVFLGRQRPPVRHDTDEE